MNKLRFYDTWDFASIRATAVIMSLLILGFTAYYLIPKTLVKARVSKYKSIAKGKLLRVDKQVVIRQTQLGNKTYCRSL